MQHEYIRDPDYPDEEPTGTRVDWAWDNFEPTKRSLQNRIYVECARFHPEILQRDAALVLEDVRNGYLSIAAADAKYGVIIADGRIDAAATAARRG